MGNKEKFIRESAMLLINCDMPGPKPHIIGAPTIITAKKLNATGIPITNRNKRADQIITRKMGHSNAVPS
jgi:hypothetical protein